MSWVCELIFSPLRNSLIAATKPFSVRPASFNVFAVLSFTWSNPKSKCSGLINSSSKVASILFAFKSAVLSSLPICAAGSAPCTFGSFAIASVIFAATKAALTLFFFNKNETVLSLSSNKACNKCSVSIEGLLLLKASCWAAAMVCCALMV